jgi:hypothetical protein
MTHSDFDKWFEDTLLSRSADFGPMRDLCKFAYFAGADEQWRRRWERDKKELKYQGVMYLYVLIVVAWIFSNEFYFLGWL